MKRGETRAFIYKGKRDSGDTLYDRTATKNP